MCAVKNKSSKPLRFCLVGAGTALHAMYGPAFRFLTEGRLTCVMDPDSEARRRAEDFRGVTAYSDLKELIKKERPEVAIIASPTSFHEEQAVMLAESGVHVFCEKPMARTPEECDRMIQACRKNKVLLGVGLMKRFNKSIRLATEWVDRKRLGRLFEVDFEWSFPAGHDHGVYAHPHSNWRGHLANWGGVFQDHGSHTIDLARLWLGRIISVSARMQVIQPKRQLEDVAVVVCRHQGGKVSTHRMNLKTHRPLMERYELFGTRGTMEIRWGGVWRWSAYTAEPMQVRVFRRGTETQDITPRPEQAIDHEISRYWHYLEELRAFCHAIRNGTEAPVSGEDGRLVAEAIVAAYQSAATDRTVKLPLTEPVQLDKIFKDKLLGGRK